MQMAFRTFIEDVSKEQVFHFIANIDDYDAWLPSSKTFLGIRHISDNPVQQGTTYVDGTGTFKMNGEIKAYEEPEQIIFHQVVQSKLLKLLPIGMNITIGYVLVQEHGGTTVIRNYQVDFSGVLRLIYPLVLSRIKPENERILQVMKNVLEKTY